MNRVLESPFRVPKSTATRLSPAFAVKRRWGKSEEKRKRSREGKDEGGERRDKRKNPDHCDTG